MSNAMMSAGGSGLPDRNIAGKNGAVGINASYPNVALNAGDTTQIAEALNGETYLAIRTPKGEYKGESYVGEALATAEDVIAAGDRAGMLRAMNLQFPDNWEVIGYGGHMAYKMSNADLLNSQVYITWANGWSATLPQGTYRVLAVYGPCKEGAIDIGIKIGGKEVGHVPGNDLYWNCDDCTFTGSGELRVHFAESFLYRNPSGVLIVVLHKYEEAL